MAQFGPSLLVFTITAILALVISCLIKTEQHFTQTMDIPTTAENFFKFMSNPMVSKELHPFVVHINILSNEKEEESETQFIIYDVTERLIFGDLIFTVNMLIHHDRLVIENYSKPLGGLLNVTTTWIVKPSEENPDTCYVTEETSLQQPWIFQYYVMSQVELSHTQLLNKAKSTIIRLSLGGFTPPRSTT